MKLIRKYYVRGKHAACRSVKWTFQPQAATNKLKNDSGFRGPCRREHRHVWLWLANGDSSSQSVMMI
ncbi:hypothetical protein OH492_19915 [Vibrio chagasii]|nr:hypothetical protein [Vibrio chagasii]